MQTHLASIDTFVSAYAQSDFFGKLIILSLIALSLICWLVLIQKVSQMRQTDRLSTLFQRALQAHRAQFLQLEIDSLPQAKQAGAPHPFRSIFYELRTKTVEILNKNLYFSGQEAQEKKNAFLSSKDLEIIEGHVLTAISTENKRMEKNLYILSTIVTLAPFLGLLGTVWGILVTFSGLHAGGSAASNSAVLGGIATALVTTVLGLLIAIPALIAYNYLKASLKKTSSDMEDFLYQLLSDVELQYRLPQ